MPSYELESSPIWVDVRKIIGSGKKNVKFDYRGQIHTEKQNINVLKVISIDTVRDYANKVGDHLQIQFKMALGDYMNCLYPYRTNLEFSFKKITLTDGADKKEPGTKDIVRRYKAVFLPDKNAVPTGSNLEQFDNASLNLLDIVDVTLQLLDRSLEPLRIKTVYGVFRGVTQKQMINALLGGESLKVLVDGKPSIDGIDVVEPDNQDTKDNIVIPNGTHVIGLPTFLQESAGGVYGGGIGTYLQYYNDKHLWFVYPVFNTKRYDATNTDKAIIYAIPQDRYPNLDRTFFKDGSILKILATTNKRYTDSADVDFMNQGSGFRMADARSFMKKPVEITADGPKGSRVNLNHESVTEERADGLNYAPVAQGGPSGNPYVQYSRVLSTKLARVDFVWENSDPDLIYPGMPCNYIFLDNNKPISLKGTIVFAHTVTALQTNGINSNIYKNVTSLVLLIDQITTEQKFKNRAQPTPSSVGVF